MAIWDDSDEESTNEEQAHEVSNVALMVIGDESLNELDEVNDLPCYDELFEAFKELHSDLKKIGLKIASLKKKVLDFSNENDSLNEKVKCLEIEYNILQNKIISFKEKPSISFEHKSLLVYDLTRRMKLLRKRTMS